MTPLVGSLLVNGLGILGKAILSAGKEKVEEKLGIEIPDIITDKDLADLKVKEMEHEEILLQLAMQKEQAELAFYVKQEESIGKRWEADMLSDSPLSKNARPLILIYLTLAITLFASLSAVDISIDKEYISLFKELCIVVYVAYFGSRGWEKIVSMKERGKS
jgi:hypothetical protein